MERHASPALSSEKRRQHRSRAQTDRREGVKSPFLICSCFIFPFFLSFISLFGCLCCLLTEEDRMGSLEVVHPAGFLLQSTRIMAYRRMGIDIH